MCSRFLILPEMKLPGRKALYPEREARGKVAIHPGVPKAAVDYTSSPCGITYSLSTFKSVPVR